MLKKWGISFSEAISIYLHKIIEVGGIPFNVRPDDYTSPKVQEYLTEKAFSPKFNENGVATLPKEWDDKK